MTALSSFSATLAPGQEFTINRRTDFLACITASATFDVMMGDTGQWARFRQGLTFEAVEAVDVVRLRNPNGAAIELELAMGRGRVTDARLTLAGEKIQLATPQQFFAHDRVVCPPGEVRLLVLENASRREAFISNVGGTGNGGVVTSENSATGKGISVGSGDTLIIQTTALLYVRAAFSNTTDVLFDICETEFL